MGLTDRNSRIIGVRMRIDAIKALEKRAAPLSISEYVRDLIEHTSSNDLVVRLMPAQKRWIELRAKDKGYANVPEYLLSLIDMAMKAVERRA